MALPPPQLREMYHLSLLIWAAWFFLFHPSSARDSQGSAFQSAQHNLKKAGRQLTKLQSICFIQIPSLKFKTEMKQRLLLSSPKRLQPR